MIIMMSSTRNLSHNYYTPLFIFYVLSPSKLPDPVPRILELEDNALSRNGNIKLVIMFHEGREQHMNLL